MPKVSVILTSFNHEKYLREAIESALSQTFTNFELIIWDDASADGSWAIISSYSDSRIKAFRNEVTKRGIYGINKAIREVATGEYIAIHHSDDIWESDKLEKQVAFLSRHGDIGAVFTHALAIGEDGSLLKDKSHFYSKIFNQPNRTRHEWLRYFFSHSNALCHPSVLIRRSCYEECGLYQYGIAQLGDLGMWIRLCLKYDIHVMPEKLIRFRVRDNSENASAGPPQARYRYRYEFLKLLSYYQRIDRFEELVKIFPSAEKYYRNEETDMGFVLGMIALEEESFAATKLFGLELVFEAISDQQRATNIKRLYDFDYKCFIALTGQHDVFSDANAAHEIASLNRIIAERDVNIDILEHKLNEILKSKSWLLTKPFRYLQKCLSSWEAIITRQCISNRARWIWRHLPISIRNKQKLKHTIFKTLPFIFDKSNVYSDSQNFPQSIGHDQAIHEHVALYKGMPLHNKPAKLICFYLPQFHSIAENDAWWGKGFTEWSNVQPAQPQFIGHYQPHVPGELSYYNLLDPTVQRRQVELAKLYGIEGFCFYFYWFGGKRLLEAPIRNYLNDSSLDMPFCLCWANENWSRRWDGLDNEILISQQHSEADDYAFIEYVSEYLKDDRYIRVDGKPLLLVYRPRLLPSAKETVKRWRKWCLDNGIGDIYLAYTQSFEAVDPKKYGFDAAIEFPPNNMAPPIIKDQVPDLLPSFTGQIYDWRAFPERSKKYNKPPYTLFRGVNPSWDNSARRKSNGTVLYGSSPFGYLQWLSNAIKDTVKRFPKEDERLVFVNAWNEWAEGAHLEPDERYGYAYLEATRMALLKNTVSSTCQKNKNPNILAIVVHAFYVDIFEEILGYLDELNISFKLFVTTTIDQQVDVEQLIIKHSFEYHLLPLANRGRDILPFLKIMPKVIEDGFEVILKLHTKKSMHRNDGYEWRNDIYKKLLGNNAKQIVQLLNKTHEVGIVGPEAHVVPMTFYLGSNAKSLSKLASRMGIYNSEVIKLPFVAGTMFYAKVDALLPLLNLAILEHEFEHETGQIDGTMAHSIERAFSISAFAAGLKINSTQNFSKAKNINNLDNEYKFAS